MREKYESLSLATLKDLAKARGLKGISTLRKPELIERMLQEDEKESTGGEAEMKKTEILQEEPGRQENRVRENRTSYEVNERKTYQDKNYPSGRTSKIPFAFSPLSSCAVSVGFLCAYSVRSV